MVNFRGRNILVLGMARSGVAVAKLLHRLGAKVTVNEKKERAAVENDAALLESLGIRVITGGHPTDLFESQFDLVVKNPGIPYTAPPVVSAVERGIPVVTEVEIAYSVTKAPFLGITGSNGKTTTTSLIGEILRMGGKNPVVAGNIGRALSEVVESVAPDQWIVAELSSFQLMGTRTFRPKIGAILNIYQAHLDYHGSMGAYLEAKLNMFSRQTEDDVAIVNGDIPELCRKVREVTRGRLHLFSRLNVLEEGTFVKDGLIVSRSQGVQQVIAPVSDIALPGTHNLENILAAVAAASTVGVQADAIRSILRTFRGVEHRLEFVRELRGVRFYNDSKATNAEAATKAITSFAEPVVLIAGGLDRGDDFKALDAVLHNHVKALIVLGESRDKMRLAGKRAGINDIREVSTIEEAVQEAGVLALAGDVVLLSPACASWDMFPSFEVRGSMFKDAVNRL